MKSRQFTLRGALLSIAIVAIVLGWFARQAAERRKQRRLVETATEVCRRAGCSPSQIALENREAGESYSLLIGGPPASLDAIKAVVRAALITELTVYGELAASSSAELEKSFRRQVDWPGLGALWIRNTAESRGSE